MVGAYASAPAWLALGAFRGRRVTCGASDPAQSAAELGDALQGRNCVVDAGPITEQQRCLVLFQHCQLLRLFFQEMNPCLFCL